MKYLPRAPWSSSRAGDLPPGHGPRHRPNAFLDITRVKQEVGYRPEYTIERALDKYLDPSRVIIQPLRLHGLKAYRNGDRDELANAFSINTGGAARQT